MTTNWLVFLQYTTVLSKIVTLVILAFSIKVFLKLLKNGFKKIIKKPQTRYRLHEYAALAAWLLFSIMALLLFEHEIGKFAIPFSVIAAGIAFALQELIASIAGRIVIVVTQLYQIGDRIEINEMKGDVIAIGFLRTSLMEIGKWVKADQHTGRVIHITNSTVLKNTLTNYSATFPFVWDEVVIPIRYGSDQHLAKKIILEITDQITREFQRKAQETWINVQERYMIEESDFASAVTLVANDNWLEFTARYIIPFRQRRAMKDQLCSAYVDAFAKTQKKVEYASMTIEITNFPIVKVDSE